MVVMSGPVAQHPSMKPGTNRRERPATRPRSEVEQSHRVRHLVELGENPKRSLGDHDAGRHRAQRKAL
jgi:hypothetical protein